MTRKGAVHATGHSEAASPDTHQGASRPATTGGHKPGPLAVHLPDLSTVPGAWRGATHVVHKLLGSGDANPKLRKSNAAGTPYRTWGLALAPARESGHQLCSASSPAGRASCLYRQGHGR